MNKNHEWGLLVACLALITIINAQQTSQATLSDESSECISCHAEQARGIFADWSTSKHYQANVGCYECHQAQSGDKDLFEHEGYDIAIIVSPKDCARCHPREVKEFGESHHAKAGLILGSLDNFLADIVEGDKSFYGGSALTVSGCQQCHGAVVEVNLDGSLKSTGWPNTGMGRLNPDGSAGACTACHQRHAFSVAQVRRPENCGDVLPGFWSSNNVSNSVKSTTLKKEGFAVRQSRYTPEQIAFALRQAELGTPVKEVIRKMGISEQTFYRWKKKYGGLDSSDLRRLKVLDEENRRLKQMVADLSLDKSMLQEVLSKKL